ncbi:MAG: hypothetical protein Q7P63_16655 [Verrucomicrobiota bacterium JB022]|nr:hypothetical protein [Verrucomicrobiota bacterium JB022]
MDLRFLCVPVCTLPLFITGCSWQEFKENSPTGQLLAGELNRDQYLDAITAANEEQRRRDQFEFNRDPTRAFNPETGEYEFVDEDTRQEWNPDTQRWEITRTREAQPAESPSAAQPQNTAKTAP